MKTVTEAAKPEPTAPNKDELEVVRAEVHALINMIHKPDVLQAMKVLLEPQVPEQETDFWQELTPEYQVRLLKSMEAVGAGEETLNEGEFMSFLEKLKQE